MPFLKSKLHLANHVWFNVGDRHSILRLIQIQIRVRIRILSRILHMLESQIFDNFYLQQSQFTLFYLSPRQRCINFQYFGQYIEIFCKKEQLAFYIGWNGQGTRIRIGRPWMPMRIRIVQNDAGPTGSGFTILIPIEPIPPLFPSFLPSPVS